MESSHFHHALKVLTSVCTGCTHCMNSCPTGAIRIRNGKAVIFDNKCIDCGHCYRVCPVEAITVEQDDFNSIYSYKYRVALLPAVVSGQFPEKITIGEVFQALYSMGFTHVYEIDHTVETLIDEYKNYLVENAESKPLISSFCPAIVRLIQVRFPSLVDQIMPIKPPMDIATLYYKQKLIDEGGHPDEIGIFYITPCAAKIAAIKSPVGEKVSPISGVINIDALYNRISMEVSNNPGADTSKLEREHLTPAGILWSLTGGEISHFEGRCIAIDGIEHVIQFLEKLENDELDDIDFLELRACDQGCAGGILTPANRFLTVERLRNRAKAYKQTENEPIARDIDKYHDYLVANRSIDKVEPRPMLRLDEDLGKALEKMQRVRKLMCYLPGFDCGCCGSPSCQTLAEDIVKEEANMSNCIFMQRIMEANKKLSAEHSLALVEKIWGSERLSKNCYKKGAQYEGFNVNPDTQS